MLPVPTRPQPPQQKDRAASGRVLRGDGPAGGRGGSVSPSASAEETKVKSPLVGEYAGGGPGGCISRPLRACGGGGGCSRPRLQGGHGAYPHARPTVRPASREMQAGNETRNKRRRPRGLPRDCPHKVLSVATAQTPRRRRPDRTITVTAQLGLALCNVLSHWLP